MTQRYNPTLLEEFVGVVLNLDTVIEKIDGVAAKTVAAMRIIGERIPSTYFHPSSVEPSLIDMDYYLRSMTRDAIRSAFQVNSTLADDDPNEVERGVAGDDTFQVDAYVDEWVGNGCRVHVVISRLY